MNRYALLGLLSLVFAASVETRALPAKTYGAIKAAPAPLDLDSKIDLSSLSADLKSVRRSISNLEKRLLSSLKTQKDASKRLAEFKEFTSLHQKEVKLSKARMTELSRVVQALEIRQSQLKHRILEQQKEIRSFLKQIVKSDSNANLNPSLEKIEGPRRKALSRLANLRAREIEAFKIDLTDSEELAVRIEHERAEITYALNDLKEREAMLEFHRKLQYETFKKHVDDRIAQLEKYNKLKNSEEKVEGLITEFNARLEFDRIEQQEKKLSAESTQAFLEGSFIKFKGRLPWPVVGGKIVNRFGKSNNPELNVSVFKKGVDIAVSQRQEVKAIFPGKVVYSGELPGYNNVSIVDHGGHFYSLLGNLDELTKKVGDRVSTGDQLGVADEKGTPLYFEIRSRNVAVNPLQWVVN